MNYRDILFSDEQLGPYPLEKLKRVEKPTTRYFGEIKRRNQQEQALEKSNRGDYGDKVKEKAREFMYKEPISAAMADIQFHLAAMQSNPVAPKKAPIPEDSGVLSRHIKSLGYFLGAHMIGICRLPQSAVYTCDLLGNSIEADYKYAIVFIVGKNQKTLAASSGYDWISDAAAFQTYNQLALQTEATANYIRRLGYEAEASFLFRYSTLMPQLILEAGLGELSRIGIILNPFVGAAMKAAAVLTNLPLEIDKPIDFGLQEYCTDCKICAEQCMAKALPSGDKIEYNGYDTWKVDERKCVSFSMLNKKGKICGRCEKVCPWNRPDISPEHYRDWDGDMSKIIAEVDRQREIILSNGFSNSDEVTGKWWFDLGLEGEDLIMHE